MTDLKKAAAESLNNQVIRRDQNVDSISAAQQPKKYLELLFNQSRNQFEKLVPNKEQVDRILRVALTYISKNPFLERCDPKTILGCLFQSTQLGLEIGVLGQADMIPFKNKKNNTYEAQFLIGYQGLLLLAQRSGMIQEINSAVVYEGDHFEYEYGLNAKLIHKPLMKDTKTRERLCAYAYAKTKDGGFYFAVMPMYEMERIRNRYSGAPDSPAWKNETDWMYRKTVLRQLSKMLPKETSSEGQKLWRATILDDAVDKGYRQGLNIDDVKDGHLEINENKIYSEAEEIDPVDEDQSEPDPGAGDPRLSDPTFLIECLESCTDLMELNSLADDFQPHLEKMKPADQKLINTVYRTQVTKISKGK